MRAALRYAAAVALGIVGLIGSVIAACWIGAGETWRGVR